MYVWRKLSFSRLHRDQMRKLILSRPRLIDGFNGTQDNNKKRTRTEQEDKN